MAIAREVVRLHGRVVAERVATGTGGEHVAAVVHTSEGEKLQLVRLGGNPFDDDQTRALVGKDVTVDGYRFGDQLRYISVK